MPESLRTRVMRVGWNFAPCYRGTGARITYIARDWKEVRLELPLNWRTVNIFGSIFGGSIYGAVDPVYVIMLTRRLGSDYTVWSKAAHIQFKRPGRTTLDARFELTEGVLDEIRAALKLEKAIDRHFVVDLIDRAGKACASVDLTIFIGRKEP